jgi:hypothetical protein
VFDEVRRLLDAELGLYPGPDLRETQRRILTSDPTLGAPATPTTMTTRNPTQLPPDLPDFVGRADLAAHVADALTPSDASVPVIGVDGLAGVGKTAFAVHVGHLVAANFPDGQLFVDLASAGEPLAEFLRGIGVPDAGLPESFSERVTLWRTLTTGRRLLVVADGATDAARVQPLLPGVGGAAVLITAQQRLYGLAHATWLTLGGLTEADSVALLALVIGTDRVGREPDEVRALARRCAGFPQVLQAVGARIAARPTWTIAEAAPRGQAGARLTGDAAGVRGHRAALRVGAGAAHTRPGAGVPAAVGGGPAGHHRRRGGRDAGPPVARHRGAPGVPCGCSFAGTTRPGRLLLP